MISVVLSQDSDGFVYVLECPHVYGYEYDRKIRIHVSRNMRIHMTTNVRIHMSMDVRPMIPNVQDV